MIEDPREVERRRLLGIDDSDAPTREDLVEALEEVILSPFSKLYLHKINACCMANSDNNFELAFFTGDIWQVVLFCSYF